MISKILTYALFIFMLFAIVRAETCPDQHIPEDFYFSSIINSLNLQLETYFNSSCPSASYPNISSPFTQINTGYIFNQTNQRILSGLIYPQNLTYQLTNSNSTATLRWYSNHSLSSSYDIDLNGTMKECGFALLFIDYGMYKNEPAYQVVGLCSYEIEGETKYRGYWVMKYRAENHYNMKEFEVPSVQSIDPKSLITTYSYDGSSYSASIRAVSHNYSNFQFLVFSKSSAKFILENSQSISAKIGAQVDIVGVLFGLDRSGSITAYLDRKGKLIFYRSAEQKQIWEIPNAQIKGQISFYRFCWSSVLGVYLGDSLVFVNFVELGVVQEIGRVSAESGLQFVVMGSYLVGYKGDSIHLYHIREDGSIFYRFYNQESSIDLHKLDLNELQEDLCSTNSFYFNHNKYSLTPYSIALNSNTTVTWHWGQCQQSTSFQFIEDADQSNEGRSISDNIILQTESVWKYATLPSLDITKSCWIEIDDSSFFILGQSQTDIDFYSCTFDQICTPFFKILNEQFTGNCFLSTLHPNPNTIIINGIFSNQKQSTILQISKQINQNIRLVTRLKLNDKVLGPQMLYQVYKDSLNYEISYIAQTPIQNDAYCHYYIRVVNGTITAKFNYPFQFEAQGYAHCVTQGVILLYRSDESGLGVKKVGLRQNSYYVLEDARMLSEYKSATVVCSKNSNQGLIIRTDQSLSFVDRLASKIADWKINKAWAPQYLKQTDTYLLTYNNQQNHTQIYNKRTGFRKSLPIKTGSRLSVSFSDIFCIEEQHTCFKYSQFSKIHHKNLKKQEVIA